MAYFLGINCGHCASVSLIKDGEVLFIQSEERLCRIKNAAGFPTQTLQYIYRTIVSPDEIAGVALNAANPLFNYDPFIRKAGFKTFDPNYYLSPTNLPDWRKVKAESSYDQLVQLELDRRAAMIRHDRDPAVVAEALDFFCSSASVDASRLHFIEHHLCHAFSASPSLYGRKSALIFTLDGYGDESCGSVGVFEGDEYTLLSLTPRHISIGKLYKTVTGILGMKCGEHEHKVMGLAPYGASDRASQLKDELKKIININSDGNWECGWINFVDLESHLEQFLKYQRFDVIACAVQSLLEELVSRWVNHWMALTGRTVLGLAGGVFMNIKLNKVLHELPCVTDLYVVPSPGDESTSFGAALCAARNGGSSPICPLSHAYMGRSFDDSEVSVSLEEVAGIYGYEVRKSEAIDLDVADLLSRGEVVGRFDGRMEFGARALGNRSILANPSDIAVSKVLNRAIKNRDFWMPFSPSILAEELLSYCVNSKGIDSPFMMMGFQGTELAQTDLAAALHPHDGTLRPHVVHRDVSPSFHALISAFRARTGIGAVLNTSFNLHGEPIVCSPDDALRTFERSGLRYLALGGYLISKRTA